MLKVTLDTNVIVRMVLAKPTTLAGKLYSALKQERYAIVFSPALVEEIAHTLKSPHLRAKHGWSDDRIDQYLADLMSFCVITAGSRIVRIPALVNRDPKDNIVMAAALEEHAPLLVTQDKDLLSLHKYHGVRTVDPREFYQILQLLESN